MTELERGVVSLLKDNARMSLGDIAAALKSTSKTIEDCIRTLEERGVLVGYTAVINDELLDSASGSIRALVELSVSPEKKTGYDAIAKRIYNYPNVAGLYLLSGQYDFLVVVEGASHKDISAFVFNKLATQKNVTSTNTHFVFKKYKELGIVLDEEETPERMAIMA